MRVLLLRNVINHIYLYPRLNYTTGEKTDRVKDQVFPGGLQSAT